MWSICLQLQSLLGHLGCGRPQKPAISSDFNRIRSGCMHGQREQERVAHAVVALVWTFLRENFSLKKVQTKATTGSENCSGLVLEDRRLTVA